MCCVSAVVVVQSAFHYRAVPQWRPATACSVVYNFTLRYLATFRTGRGKAETWLMFINIGEFGVKLFLWMFLFWRNNSGQNEWRTVVFRVAWYVPFRYPLFWWWRFGFFAFTLIRGGCYLQCGANWVTLIAESVESTESAPMQYTNCWKSAIRQLTVTE